MPGNYAHLRFGGQMRERLPEEVKPAVEKHPRFYALGTHGPDLFFYYRPLWIPYEEFLGREYHYGDPREFFSGIVRRLGKKPKQEATAYLYGLLTHYALDSVCHPYIKEAEAEGIAGHVQMETEFDRLLLEKDGFLLPKPHFSMEHLKLSRADCALLKEFYPKATPAQIRESAITMKCLQKAFLFRQGKMAERVKAMLGKESSQYILTPRPDARCAATNQRLLELTEQASRRFGSLCEKLYQHTTRNTPLDEEFAPIFG